VTPWIVGNGCLRDLHTGRGAVSHRSRATRISVGHIRGDKFSGCRQKAGVAEGVPDLRHAEYPGTISLESAGYDREIASGETLNLIIEALTKPLENSSRNGGPARTHEIVLKGTLQAVNDFFFAQLQTDGLPVIPPTHSEVEEFWPFTAGSGPR